jgi:glycosyltransferase involved in cell wall biosynthesis
MARICFLTERLLRGWGVDHVIHRLADGLGRLGHEVDVVCLRADRSYQGGAYRVRILDVPFWPPETLEQRVIDHSGLLRQRSYDIFVASMFPFYGVARRLRLPFIYHEFGVVDPVGLDSRTTALLTRIRRDAQEHQLRAKRVAAISQFLVREQVNPARHADTDVVYLGAESYGPPPAEDAVRAFRSRLGFGSDLDVIGYVGRIERHTYKGVDQLLDVVSTLRGRHRQVGLLLAGHCDDDVTRDHFARVPGVVVRAHIPSEEMALVFSACDVVASASCWEGFNLPLVEAQFYGRPVVAFCAGAHPEVVAPSGALVADRAEFVDALELLLSDPAARRRRGEEARAFAQRFRWANTARDMAACIRAAGGST